MALYRLVKSITYTAFTSLEEVMSWLDKKIRTSFGLEDTAAGRGLVKRLVDYTVSGVDTAFSEIANLPQDYWSWLKLWWAHRANLTTLVVVTAATAILVLLAVARKNAEMCSKFREIFVVRTGEVEVDCWPMRPGGGHLLLKFGERPAGGAVPGASSLSQLSISDVSTKINRSTATSEDMIITEIIC